MYINGNKSLISLVNSWTFAIEAGQFIKGKAPIVTMFCIKGVYNWTSYEEYEQRTVLS